MSEYVQHVGDDTEFIDMLNLGHGEVLQPTIDELFLGTTSQAMKITTYSTIEEE